jgi:WD40 repeat protein
MSAEEEIPRVLGRLAAFLPPRDQRYRLFHRSIFDWLTGWDKIVDQPVAGAYHVSLRQGHDHWAKYFWSVYQSDQRPLTDEVLRFLPTHLVGARRWDDIARILLDWRFLEAKVSRSETMVFDLVADFALAVTQIPADYPQHHALELVQQAHILSTHVVAKDSKQLAGQLLGRLSHDDAPEIGRMLDDAAGWRGSAWLKPLGATLEHPGGSAVRTLHEHDGPVRAEGVWLDARIMISGSSVDAVAVTPDGRVAVSGSTDGTVKMWDLAQTMEMAAFTGETGIHSCAVADDAVTIVAGEVSGRFHFLRLQR